MVNQICVGLIGSTGGGTATLGNTDPPELLRIIDHELQKIEGDSSCIGITKALFVALDGGKSFDSVNETTDTSLLYQVSNRVAMNSPLQCHVAKSAVLKEVNAVCKDMNKELAKAISNGEINALICISVSVDIFAETLKAAAKADIPVTGTGGTSLSQAASKFQIRLVGNAGGSVANTSLTRAVSYSHALATDLKAIYRPWRKVNMDRKALSFRSILNACLPAFWGICLLKRVLVSASLIFEESEMTSLLFRVLENNALPTACAVVAAASSCSATNTQQDSSSRIMASVIASTVCWKSALSGLLAGYLVNQFQENVLFWCVVNNIPATMTNLVTTGGVGGALALVLLPITPLFRFATTSIRDAILLSVTTPIIPPGVVAFLWGAFCCYGSKIGWYHAVFLPLILIEMECGNASFLGALDELTLVLVCAGVCSGQLIGEKLFPKRDLLSEADLALCRRAVRINLSFGDFVEACYPFMDRSLLLNMSCYIASGLSSSILVILQQETTPSSLAYLPLPIAVWLAGSEWIPMLLASVFAFVIPFGASIINLALQNKPSSR